MKLSPQLVLSASRRTDIPAFYMKWFMDGIQRGFFETINPYNQKRSHIRATPKEVHTIVFWSKNFGPFLEGGYGEKLYQAGYNLFFNFTVNSTAPLLEPNLPPLTERLNQMGQLCNRLGADCVTWRFDPICNFQTQDGKIHDNLHDFSQIAEKAYESGIKRCITSFMDHYPKIKKRIKFLKGFSFVDPPLAEKQRLLLKMKTELNDKGITLSACCEKEIIDKLSPEIDIKGSSCIPNDLLINLYGGRLSLKKDTGQRIKQGCGCMTSVDIGSYHFHPCFHNCLFCYANPAPPTVERKS